MESAKLSDAVDVTTADLLRFVREYALDIAGGMQHTDDLDASLYRLVEYEMVVEALHLPDPHVA